MKLEELNTTKKLVEHILREKPYTRNSNDFLYYEVCKLISQMEGHNFEALRMGSVLLSRERLGFPCYESVRRARQKAQRFNPELAGDTQVEAYRLINEEAYKEFGRSFE